MTIATRDQLISALASNRSPLTIDKAAMANAAIGQYFSLWRATGAPGQGAIPAAVASCTNALLGGMSFTQQTAPATSYAAWASVVCTNSAVTMELHDRLRHMGGLNGTLLTAQTVGLALNGVTADNMVARIGAADMSEVNWWAEWYTDTGATASNATVAVTYTDATTGNLSVFAAGGTVRAGRCIPLNSLIPNGKIIRSIDSVTLSASTATAGNFGFTCTRPLAVMPLNISNKSESFDWAQLGLAEVPNSACLALIQICGATTTGTVRGGIRLAHG